METSKILFSLKRNKLSNPETVDYYAVTHGYKTITQDQLVEIMAGANTTVSRHDIIDALDLLESVIEDSVSVN